MWCCCLDWSETPLETLLQQSSLFLNIVWVRKLFSSSRSSISRSPKWWIVFITMSSCLHLNNVLDCGHKPWQSWPWCGRHQAHKEEPVSVSVSRTNQSPALSLYCTHTLTAQRKKEMPKIVSVPPGLPAHSRGWLCVLVQAPVLYLRHHVTHMWCTLTKYTKCSSHTFYQTTEVKRKWKHAVNKTSEVSVLQRYKVTWIIGLSALHLTCLGRV